MERKRRGNKYVDVKSWTNGMPRVTLRHMHMNQNRWSTILFGIYFDSARQVAGVEEKRTQNTRMRWGRRGVQLIGNALKMEGVQKTHKKEIREAMSVNYVHEG